MGSGGSKTKKVKTSKNPASVPAGDVTEAVETHKERPVSGATIASAPAGRSIDPANRNTSAVSKRSNDSGIGSVEPDKQEPVPQTFRPERRVDSAKIISSLRDEGLLDHKRTNTAIGGVCFEVALSEEVEDQHQLQPARKPPARLVKLERQKQYQLTMDKLNQKLDLAEKRRKKRQVDSIQKSKQKESKNLEVKLMLMEVERQNERKLERKLSQKLNVYEENRSKYLDKVKDQQAQKEVKAQTVRDQKALSPRPPIISKEEREQMMPRPSPRNVDDVPVAAARQKAAYLLQV